MNSQIVNSPLGYSPNRGGPENDIYGLSMLFSFNSNRHITPKASALNTTWSWTNHIWRVTSRFGLGLSLFPLFWLSRARIVRRIRFADLLLWLLINSGQRRIRNSSDMRILTGCSKTVNDWTKDDNYNEASHSLNVKFDTEKRSSIQHRDLSRRYFTEKSE